MPFCVWIPAIPANARAGFVLLKRPCTFLVALLLGAAGAFTALFYAVTKIRPPSCPAEESPRTRPRPVSPLRATHAEPTPAPSLSSSLHSLVTAPFRPAASRGFASSRRLSGRRHGEYVVHELDGVLEAREEEEAEDSSEASETGVTGGQNRHGRPAPAHEGSEDTSSEADTLVDQEAVAAMDVHTRGGKNKVFKAGLIVLTHGLRWMAPHSPPHGHAVATADEAIVVDSPDDYAHSDPASPPVESADSGSTSRKVPCPVRALRHRAATCSVLPRVPATSLTSSSRRVVSNGRDYFSHSPRQSSGSATPPSESTLTAADVHTHLSASKAQSRPRPGFFRSLSPRSRSPIATPDASPPPSPRLESSAAARIGSQRTPASASATVPDCSLKRRARAPAPQRPNPVASKPSSNATIDMQGSSGLELSDLLSHSFRT